MTCRDIDEFLSSGQFSLEAEAHLRSCSRCRELAGVARNAPERPGPDAARLEAIERMLLAELTPVRPLPSQSVLALGFAVIFAVVSAVCIYLLGTAGFRAMGAPRAAIVYSGLAASAVFLFSSLAALMVPGSRHLLAPRRLFVLVLLGLAAFLASTFGFEREQDFLASWWACFRAGVPIAILAGVLFVLVLSRGAVLSARLTGAVGGLLAGLAGMSVLEVRCPNLDAWHRLTAHLGVALAGAVIGYLLGWAAQFLVASQSPNWRR